MSRIECTECHDLIDTTARTVVLPFVCDECQKAPELLEAMAPAPLKIEESDNVACDCTPADEATNLLLEDLQNQLDITKNEAETLRTLLLTAEDRESQLRQNIDVLLTQKGELQTENRKLAEETAKSFFEAFFLKITNSLQVEKLKALRKDNFMWAVRYRGLQEEFRYAAKRLFELAAANALLDKAGKALGKLYEDSQEELNIAYKARDVWQKRAEIAKRAYDRASADRRYYRDKCREAGIKA